MRTKANQMPPEIKAGQMTEPGSVMRSRIKKIPTPNAAPRRAHFHIALPLPGEPPSQQETRQGQRYKQSRPHCGWKAIPVPACPQAKARRNMTLPEVS